MSLYPDSSLLFPASPFSYNSYPNTVDPITPVTPNPTSSSHIYSSVAHTSSSSSYQYDSISSTSFKHAPSSLPLSPYVPASSPVQHNAFHVDMNANINNLTVLNVWEDNNVNTTSGSSSSSSSGFDSPSSDRVPSDSYSPPQLYHRTITTDSNISTDSQSSTPPATHNSTTRSIHHHHDSSSSSTPPTTSRRKRKHSSVPSIDMNVISSSNDENGSLSPDSLAKFRRLRHNMSDQQRRIGIKEAIERLRTIIPFSAEQKINQVTLLNNAIDLLQQFQQENIEIKQKLIETEKKRKLRDEQLKLTLQQYRGVTSIDRNIDLPPSNNTGVSQCALDAAGICISFVSLDGRLLYCNRQFETFSGFSAHEIVGKGVDDLPFISRPEYEAREKDGLSCETVAKHLVSLPNNHVIKVPCVMLTKAKVQLSVTSYISLIRNAAGTPLYMQTLCIPRDAQPIVPKQKSSLLLTAGNSPTSYSVLSQQSYQSHIASAMRPHPDHDIDTDPFFHNLSNQSSHASAHLLSPLASSA